jgi:hypothetical protein
VNLRDAALDHVAPRRNPPAVNCEGLGGRGGGHQYSHVTNAVVPVEPMTQLENHCSRCTRQQRQGFTEPFEIVIWKGTPGGLVDQEAHFRGHEQTGREGDLCAKQSDRDVTLRAAPRNSYRIGYRREGECR